MKTGYSALTPAAGVALATGVAKTILTAITPATFGLDLLKIRIGFDSVTATDRAVVFELVAFTADGTGTAGTVNPVYGRGVTTASIPVGFTSKTNYSIEPTGATVLDLWSLTPIGGTALLDLPLSATPDIGISTILGIRCTAPGAAVNARGGMWFERC